MAGNAREVALLTLEACEKQGAWSDLALKKNIHDAELDRRDAALATRLCFGVLQNRTLCDFYLSKFSVLAPEKMENKVRNALRLGIYQMAFLDKIPASAAVNESVELTKKYSKNPRSAALVNGVLRAVSRKIDALPVIEAGSSAEYLAIRYSHPLWLVTTLLELIGRDETEALLALQNGETATVAQVNTVCANTNHVLASLVALGADAQLHPWLSDCITLTGGGDLEQLTAFQKGELYIQDAAARLAVLAADVRAGMRVLDCCAAPGGKSCAAAVAMHNEGEIVSGDLHPHKKALIANAAHRLGLSIIHPVTLDASKNEASFAQSFDVVIADVPCSGLGIIRKKPDIRFKDPAPLVGLPAVQGAILNNVAEYVKPGGALLYCTCTILPRENEDVVSAFLAQNKKFSAEAFTLPGPVGEVKNGSITLWPQRHGTDGFFLAKLRRCL